MDKRRGKILALLMAAVLMTPVRAFALGEATDVNQVHYGQTTEAQNKVLYEMFDADFYAKAYPDVVEKFGSSKGALFEHFKTYGVFEGRSLNASFNVSAYKSSYEDLEKAYGDDMVAYYMHYQEYGKAEERDLTTVEKAILAGIQVKSIVTGTVTPDIQALADEINKAKEPDPEPEYEPELRTERYDDEDTYTIVTYDEDDNELLRVVYSQTDDSEIETTTYIRDAFGVVLYEQIMDAKGNCTETYYEEGDPVGVRYMSVKDDGTSEELFFNVSSVYDEEYDSYSTRYDRRSRTLRDASGRRTYDAEFYQDGYSKESEISYTYSGDTMSAVDTGFYEDGAIRMVIESEADIKDEETVTRREEYRLYDTDGTTLYAWYEITYDEVGRHTDTKHYDASKAVKTVTLYYEITYDDSGNETITQKDGDGNVLDSRIVSQ